MLHTTPEETMNTETTCDICGQAIVAGERVQNDCDELVHTACVRDWFRRNFGREGLA